MSHPQPKRPSTNTLIRTYSKARVIAAVQVHPLMTKASNIRSITDADARAQVASLR